MVTKIKWTKVTSSALTCTMLHAAIAPRLAHGSRDPTPKSSCPTGEHTDGAILALAGLGSLGLGAVPPRPAWSAMFNEARDDLFLTRQQTLYPGAAMLPAGPGFTLLGDGPRDALNPEGR